MTSDADAVDEDHHHHHHHHDTDTDTDTDTKTIGLAVTAPNRVELIPADAVPSDRGGRPFPEQGPLGSDEVFGRTICTLVSPGTEIAGTFRPVGDPSRMPYPWIPGYASVFVIETVGENVSTLEVGDAVFSLGGHRSHQREHQDAVWRLPPGLDPFDAVFARLLSVPMTTLTTTSARPGARVGVSGLGPVGHLAALAFAATGHQVTAWDPRTDRREMLPASVDVRADAPPPLPSAQYGTTEGFDLILECSGHDGAVLAATRCVRSGGEVVLVGAPWTRRTDATAHDVLVEVFHRYVTLRSGWEWQVPAVPTPFVQGSRSGNVELALRWLTDGTVAVGHLADRFRPSEAQAVYEYLADSSTRKLTALFDWR